MEAGGEVGAEGLAPAELPKGNPEVFKLHARQAAQVTLAAIKEAVQVPGHPRRTAKLRSRYVAQFAAAMAEAAERI